MDIAPVIPWHLQSIDSLQRVCDRIKTHRIPVDLKKVIDIVDKVVKEIVFNEQNSKVNGLENEIPDTS